MKKLLIFVLLAGSCIIASPAARAQYYFGKNKVQYKHFHWKVLSSENFDVYYYAGTEQAVMTAARMAERSYARLSHILDHDVKEKIPLILYASHTDFQSTNIQPGFIGEGTGGVTEFLKRRVYLPFTGSFAELEHVMTHELVHAFQVDILWGGKRSSTLGNPFSYQPPLWVMEGSAEYLSLGGLDPLTEMWLRDASLEGYLIPIPRLSATYDIRVYRFGQSIFEHVARHYGPESVGKILKGIARTRDVSLAFQKATGKTLKKISQEWSQEVRETYLPQIRDYDTAEEIAKRLTNSDEDAAAFNLVPGVSPAGDKVAFISTRGLTNGIFIASTLDGKILKKLVEGQRAGDLEALRFFRSSIDWSPDGTRIVFPAKTGGRDVVYVYDVDSGKRVSKIDPDLDAILSPSWSPDGTRLVFTGNDGGQSDLFTCDADGKNLQRLTNDFYSTMTPRYHPTENRIVFTTDRGPDTDHEALEFGPQRVAELDITTGKITVLPSQVGKSIAPHYSPDGKSIIFVSDRTGVSNIYRVHRDSLKVQQLTNILTGVTGITEGSPPLSISRNGKRLVFSAFNKGGWDLYSLRDPFGMEPIALEETATAMASAENVRRATGLGDLIRDYVDHQIEVQIETASISPGSVSAEDLVTVLALKKDQMQDVSTVHPDDSQSLPAKESSTIEVSGTDVVLPFQSQMSFPRAPKDSLDRLELLEALQALPDTSKFEHQDYRAKFSADYGAAAAGAGGGVGVAGQAVVSFSDVLGNKQLAIGASVYGSLTEADILVRYADLGKRVNYGGSVFQFRNNFLLSVTSSANDFQSNIYRGANVFVSLPFSTFTRIEGSLEAMFVSERLFSRDYDANEITRTDLATYFYVSPRLAYVKDTAIYGPTGPIKGKRLRLQARQGIGGASFTSLRADLRNYWHLGGRYSVAMRFLGATSFGADPEIYRIGGPYTIRSVDYGGLEGSNIILGNLELRFPFLNFLDLAFPLPLQLGGVRGAVFLDVGSAWGEQYLIANLSDEEQEQQRIFTPWTSDGGFRLDDLSAAYGFGVRLNLGYFLVRWDLARATDFQSQGKWRGYFALGAEF